MASSSFHLPDSPPAGYVFPPRAGSSASTREPAANVHLTALKADTRHVAIVVTETTSRAPPKLHITPPSQCIPPPPPGPPPFSSDSRPSTPPVRNDPTLQLTPPENGANTQSNRSSPTLMRNGSAASNHYEDDTVTPVMRSMFPRFDTAQPVPQPHLLSQPPPAALVRNSTGGYSPSLYSQRSPPMEMDPWAANRLSSLMIPRVSSVRITEEPSPSASNTEQLLELWNVANGQGSENPEDYVLNLEW